MEISRTNLSEDPIESIGVKVEVMYQRIYYSREKGPQDQILKLLHIVSSLQSMEFLDNIYDLSI